MKPPVLHPGMLPVAPPFLEWEDLEDDDFREDDDEIDLTDLIERPVPPERMN